MTGAAIPEGCNAVVMLELTEEFEENRKDLYEIKTLFRLLVITFLFKGEDVKQNAILVKKGTYY